MGQRRYPGATPFNSRQSQIFYGRDKDIERLLTFIQVEKKILLYSKSGLGKTSLLEAGVIPKLPKNYIPISIRLFAYKVGAETPVERVIEALKLAVGDLDEKNDTIIDRILGDHVREKTLWYYFKKAQLLENQRDENVQEKIFTLVFDQFEELFSFPKSDIEDFKNQLYELTELKLPDHVAVLVAEGRQTDRELFSRENLGILHKKTDIKTIFAIRSDRLSLLNNLSDKLPDIQQSFYELLPLDYDQARQAIVNPAKDPEPVFDTPSFTFHKDACDKIIKELSEGYTENIETTQLQIVCHRIEDIAAAKPGNGPRQIEVGDLPEFKNIFLNFYFDSINRLPEEDRDKAKRLIEDELIRNHQRISLDEEICKGYLKDEELKTLVDTHLLRAERNTFGRISYEISHDTLIEPILESQKTYRENLERIRLENEQKEELRKLREQQENEAREREEEMKRIREEQKHKEKERQRKIRQQRTIIMIVSVFLVISIGLGLFGYFKMLEAEVNRKEAVKAYDNYKKSEFIRNYTEGETFFDKAQYQQALDRYEVAGKIMDSLDVTQQISESRRLIENRVEHESLIKSVDSLKSQREYLEAMKALNKAIEQGYDSLGVQQKRKDLYDQAILVFTKDLDDYKDMKDSVLYNHTLWEIKRLDEVYKIFNK